MRKILSLLILLTILSCEGPEPRKPVKVKSGSFMKESVERNKKLLALEEEQIRMLIQQDSLREYFPTAAGSWYAYEMKNEVAEYTPKTDDLVRFTYALLTLDNDTIYSREEIGLQTYKVDKQELFPGLRNSIKLLKEGETAIFLFPSSLGYGYLGDKNKIGVNAPLKAVITIIGIERDTENKIP
ncbi:protein involved in gliding motility GldI [Muriicola jejuensis]|uniref:Peptidyl-prolyl cis-trans isomerase n=1 Tax=Muriicola jejuensis TaxID=504488 RepID=A0A6P0UI62_9FLAO|nr:gliding motility-associated peptidyl-prolyl isomerase GldI [Muriicola jejuensis]NER10813.1 gliding motility-associated peptidyl-prolyl isomerase GldI [Muriicola jejuensis]SMP16213.1 protein involved in gliding motility GldI [Muriicola jejuensis]